MNTLQALHDSGISFSIEPYSYTERAPFFSRLVCTLLLRPSPDFTWSGFRAKLGSPTIGYEWEGGFGDIDTAAWRLACEVFDRYPDSVLPNLMWPNAKEHQ